MTNADFAAFIEATGYATYRDQEGSAQNWRWAYAEGKGHTTLEALARDIYAVPEQKSVAGVMDEMIRRKEHIFLVVDEYGGTAGIVTLEDAIETLLGVEIMDEFDTVADMRKLAKQLGENRRRRQEE